MGYLVILPHGAPAAVYSFIIIFLYQLIKEIKFWKLKLSILSFSNKSISTNFYEH